MPYALYNFKMSLVYVTYVDLFLLHYASLCYANPVSGC